MMSNTDVCANVQNRRNRAYRRLLSSFYKTISVYSRQVYQTVNISLVLETFHPLRDSDQVNTTYYDGKQLNLVGQQVLSYKLDLNMKKKRRHRKPQINYYIRAKTFEMKSVNEYIDQWPQPYGSNFMDAAVYVEKRDLLYFIMDSVYYKYKANKKRTSKGFGHMADIGPQLSTPIEAGFFKDNSYVFFKWPGVAHLHTRKYSEKCHITSQLDFFDCRTHLDTR